MKLTVRTVKQSVLVNLSGIVTAIRMKLQNTVWKQTTTLAGIRRKLLIRKTVNSKEDKRNRTFFEES